MLRMLIMIDGWGILWFTHTNKQIIFPVMNNPKINLYFESVFTHVHTYIIAYPFEWFMHP